MDIAALIAGELGVRPTQVQAVIQLVDDGCTIPFIARYRKEATGGLDDVQLRKLDERLGYLQRLEERKAEVLAAVDALGQLTVDLRRKVGEAVTLQRVEDLYKPFKKTRATRASKARDAGLGPLAAQMMAQGAAPCDPYQVAARFARPDSAYPDAETALQGAADIVAEEVASDPDAVDELRGFVQRTGVICSKATADEAQRDFAPYVDFCEPLRRIPGHRVLALNRGEAQGQLRVSVDADGEEAVARLKRRFLRRRGPWTSAMQAAIRDGYKRLAAPSLEREARAACTARAQEDAIAVFAKNTEALLRQRPVKGARIIAIDPGYRTGCKVAVIDEYGQLLDHGVVFPTPPRNQVQETKQALKRWADRYRINVIVVGNGTASRETEEVVAQFVAEYGAPLEYTIVNEAGASVYSASELASQEHPDLDVTTRGALSLGRRLQDPLAELVKIPPQSIGVGQYQHDLDQKQLAASLAAVVERVVNQVGADLNTASASLLGYISGITPALARNIVAYREENGPFTSRSQLKKVPKLGPKAFQNCAGFLRISGGKEPLDATGVHPESYGVAREVLKTAGLIAEDLATGTARAGVRGSADAPERMGNGRAQGGMSDVRSGTLSCGGVPDLRQRLGNLDELSQRLGVGLPTLCDIVAELEKPGRDPREDAPAPVFSRAVLSMDQLKAGMKLTGTVRNVVDFGTFVDIGVKQDGLVHISKMTKGFVKHPMDVVAVGDTVTVWVESVDKDRGRISLSMVELR